jgi:hypothetical protein
MMFVRLYRRFYRDNSGSTLIMVLIVFFMFMLLSMALISLSLTASTSAAAETKSEQAYLTARSFNYSTIAALTPDSAFETKIENLAIGATLTGSGNDAKLGNYTVAITKTDNKHISITTTSTVNGLKQTVKSALSLITYDASNPYDGLLYYSNDTVQHFMEGGGGTGSLIYNGDAYIAQDASFGTGNYSVQGNVFTTGNTYVSGTQWGITNLSSLKNIYLQDTYVDQTSKGVVSDNDASIGTTGTPCTIYAEGSLFMMGHSGSLTQVIGNVHVDGDVNLNSYSKIVGNIIAGGNVNIAAGCSVVGNVTAGGTITGTAISGNQTQNTVTQQVGIQYTPAKNLPILSIPSFTNTASVSKIDNDTGKIVADGILYSSSYNAFGSYSTLIVDTGTSSLSPDINLIVQNSLTLSAQQLLVTGSHNVYIYLAPDANLTISNSSAIGMKSASSNALDSSIAPKVFIIGNNQTMTLSDTSLLRANVYIPKGIFGGTWTAGSGVDNDRFKGSAVISDDAIMVYSSSFDLVYMKPDLTKTPLVGFSQGTYSTGSWQPNGWANK